MQIIVDSIPYGTLLTVKEDKSDQILPSCHYIVYLCWDYELSGMKILFSNGETSTHDKSDILTWFKIVQ